MTSLSIVNELIPTEQIQVTRAGSNLSLISNESIRTASGFVAHYYAHNSIILSLIPGDGESELTQRFSNVHDDPVGVRMVAYWKKTEDIPASGFLRDQYRMFPMRGNVTSFSNNRIVIDFDDIMISTIDRYFASFGLTRPEFGLLGMEIHYGSGATLRAEMYLIKYTHNSMFTLPPPETRLPESDRTAFITPPMTYEALFVPQLSGQFVYNFFDIEENNFDICSRRNYTRRPTKEIPKYINLTWNRSPGAIIFPPVSFSVEAPPPAAAASPRIEREDSGMYLGGIYFGGFLDDETLAGAILDSEGTRTSRDADDIYSPTPGEFSIRGDSDDLFSRASEGVDTTILDVTEEVSPGVRTAEDDIEVYGASSGYIGYVILKERFIETSGTFVPHDLIVIPRSNQTSYVDWKVAYGETYRYKIRSVFKFVNRDNLPMYMDEDALLDRSGSAQNFDSGILFHKAYYFDSDFSSPSIVPAVDLVKPEPPYNFKLYPNSKIKRIFLIWQQKNPNNDVRGFNVYRRELEPNSVFERLNLSILDIRDSYYEDFSIEVGKKYIYAIESVDVHGNRSFLSNQYIASIDEDKTIGQLCEIPIQFYAFEGLEIDELPLNDDKNVLDIEKQFKIIINPLFINLDRETPFLIRITSLDTFDQKEIKLNFKTRIINHSPPVRLPPEEEARIRRTGERGRGDIEDVLRRGFGDI